MKRVFFSFLFVFSAVQYGFAQMGEAQKTEAVLVETIGAYGCDRAKAILDNAWFHYKKDEKKAIIYLVYYTGKTYQNLAYNKKTNKYRYFTVLPRRDEALPSVKLWQDYLVKQREVETSKIKIVNGGFREEHTIEIWVAQSEVKPPTPTPTVEEKDVKFRKGKAPYWECQEG